MRLKQSWTLVGALCAASLVGQTGSARAASNPKSILVPILCGEAHDREHGGKQVVLPSIEFPGCEDLAHGKHDFLTARLEWYSGNQLLYVENGPFAISDEHGPDDGSFFIALDANHDTAQFATAYDGPTSVLTAPDLNIKLFVAPHFNDLDDPNDAPVLVYAAPFRPIAASLWSKHSEDTVGLTNLITALRTDLNTETAARLAGDNALTASLNQEVSDRKAGDAATLATAQAYTDTQVAAEAARATAAESTLSNNLNQEIAARMVADNLLQAGIDTVAANLAAESAARIAGDAATLSAAEAYGDANFVSLTKSQTVMGVKTWTDNIVASSGICYGPDCRQSFNNQDPNSINPMPRNCPAGQIAVSTGPFAWKCELNCAYGTLDCDGNPNNGCETNLYTSNNQSCVGIFGGGGVVANCGGCGQSCSCANLASGACSVGQCTGVCAQGYSDCNSNLRTDGCEVNVANDPNNCGAGGAGNNSGCGVACSNNNMATRTCGGGVCNGACAGGYADCNNNKQTDGCEQNIATNIMNCGACGVVCSSNNIAAVTCGGGVCNGACVAGYADCNNNKQTDGCEAQLASNLNNCGACGVACSTNHIAAACTNGVCGGTCNAGYADCNNNKADGCEVNLQGDSRNCGACNVACAAGKSCAGGQCVASVNCSLTKTYLIPLAQLNNLGSDCSGTGNYPYNGCNNQSYGFNWTDTGAGAVQSVTVDFTQGIVCQGGNRTTTLNGAVTAGYTENNVGSCACTPPAQGLTTLNIAPGSYVVGGANTFLILNPPSCEGFQTTAAFNAFARVTVTYGGNMVNLGNDANNCGACNNVCATPPNATRICAGGACGLGACNAGYANCNNNAADGCEVNTNTDRNNCGGCNHVCAAGLACAGGVCTQSSCINNAQWTAVTCTTGDWVWSSNEAIATDQATANAAHVLQTGCFHGQPQPQLGQGVCSLDGKGWVSTQTFVMQGCNTSWWHIGGRYTGQCGGHDGDVYRHLAIGPNDCYAY